MKLCGFEAGLDRPLFLIAGPCVVESLELQIETAGTLKEICAALGVPLTFAIIPRTPYASDAAEYLAGRGFEILCHLPMEPEGFPDVSPGEGAIGGASVTGSRGFNAALALRANRENGP